MLRLVYACLLGLVGAAIVHVVIVLLLPVVSERNAWSALSAEAGAFERISPGAGPEGPLAASIDPLFEAVACRFDLSQGPRRIAAAMRTRYWSLSVYDPLGTNVYSLNDRTAPGSQLDVVVLTPEQMLALRKEMPADLQASVFAEVGLDRAIVVVRAFFPDESWRELAADFIGGSRCSPL